jgi:hypothetical protein
MEKSLVKFDRATAFAISKFAELIRDTSKAPGLTERMRNENIARLIAMEIGLQMGIIDIDYRAIKQIGKGKWCWLFRVGEHTGCLDMK